MAETPIDTDVELDELLDQEPTVADAAQVIYEGLALMGDAPAELVAAITAEKGGPRWHELAEDTREWLIGLVRDACVPPARIDEPVDASEVITVRQP